MDKSNTGPVKEKKAGTMKNSIISYIFIGILFATSSAVIFNSFNYLDITSVYPFLPSQLSVCNLYQSHNLVFFFLQRNIPFICVGFYFLLIWITRIVAIGTQSLEDSRGIDNKVNPFFLK